MTVTIKEIARITGTSTTAVSFVINGKDRGMVSDRKKQLILRTIQKYGYKQNNLARGLQARRTFHIAFCVRGYLDDYPLLGNFSTHDALSRMTHRFSACGYSAEWLQIDRRATSRQIVAALAGARVDGLVFIKWERAELEPILPAIRRRGLHAVCFNTLLDSPVVGGCGFSLAQAADTGTQHLINVGRKHIALLDFIAGERHWLHRQHRQGYLRAMRRNQRKPLVHLEQPGRRVDLAAQVAAKFIRRHPAVDGILTTDNFYAMFVSQVIGRKDILQVSIGDTCFTELQRPKLAHLSLPTRAMADWCVQTLVDRIEAPHPPPARQQLFDCELIAD